MGKTLKFTAIFATCTLLVACGSTDLERTATGAVIGGATAKVLGEDVATGALIGGAAGATCGTTGICPNN